MGGHNAGEIAAEEAVFFLSSSVEEMLLKKQDYHGDELCKFMKFFFRQTNRYVNHLGKKYKQLHGMGTTLCSLLFYQNYLIYGHVGDSRIYLYRKGILHQLTNDHSLKNEMIRKGIDLNKRKEKIRNVLTRAIGTSSEVIPEVTKIAIEEGDIFLSCSDGLSDIVSSREIIKVLSCQADVEEKTRKLVQIALKLGGPDNITTMLIQITK
jgi:protein phosphatase